MQTETAWYATGRAARQPEPVGEVIAEAIPVSFDGTARPVQAGRIRLSAGLHSDPFFADYLGPWSQILQNAGGYTPEAARAAAPQVLPDILHYDRTRPAVYPNGRVPTDDVYSLRFAWLTNGTVPPSGLKPHGACSATSPTSARPTPDRDITIRSDNKRFLPNDPWFSIPAERCPPWNTWSP